MQLERQNPIVEQGFQSLINIVGHVDALVRLKVEALHKNKSDNLMIVDRSIPYRIERICAEQAMAYGCLFDDGNRSGENDCQRKLRLDRVSHIKKHLQGLDVKELRNKGVRNALAHYDEYMLKFIMQHEIFSTLQDISFTKESGINFHVDHLLIRCYFFDTDTVYLFDKKLHPVALRNEIELVLDRFPAWKQHLSNLKAGRA